VTESLVHLQVYVVLQKDTITIGLNQINYLENEKRYETLHQDVVYMVKRKAKYPLFRQNKLSLIFSL